VIDLQVVSDGQIGEGLVDEVGSADLSKQLLANLDSLVDVPIEKMSDGNIERDTDTLLVDSDSLVYSDSGCRAGGQGRRRLEVEG
jgi:hypothetical protein